MIGFLAQVNFAAPHAHRGPALGTLFVLLLAGGASVPTLTLLTIGAVRIRRRVRTALARRRRVRDAASAEVRARALMGELCPHGWRAQITLFDTAASLPHGAPNAERTRVALDWAASGGRPASEVIVRRVWATTVAEALDQMVADRRTDETLEQIEQGAAADGAQWPDAYME